MDVFVTKSTLYSISGVLDIDYESSSRASKAIDEIIKKYSTIPILTTPEKKALARMIVVNTILNSETPENIKTKVKKSIYEKAKKERVIFLHKNPTYHYYNNCPKITSDYKNFTIPDEIPEDRIDEYRLFFIENMELFFQNVDVFYLNVAHKFGVKISAVGRMNHRNSGRSNTQDMLKLLESDNEPCTESILKALALFQENKKLIRMFGNASHLRDNYLRSKRINEEEHSIISEWHHIKDKVKGDIFQKITKINKITDNIFSDKILDALGFFPCTTCLELKKKTLL